MKQGKRWKRERYDIPDGVMYCKLEALDANSDYSAKTHCARLFGIRKSAFDAGDDTWLRNDAFEVYLLDIERPTWLQCASHLIGQRDAFFDETEQWLEVVYAIDSSANDGPAYAYPLFTGSAPTFIKILSITPVRGRKVPPLLALAAAPASPPSSASPYVLDAFHVGQGMCSVFHNHETGFILDAGAGTPVFRKEYQEDSSFINRLTPLIKSLNAVSMVLSHFDADHWRILDWDSEILARVNEIYVPNGVASLPFKSAALKSKVTAIGNQTLLNDPVAKASLEVVRSQPIKSDKNGECLIAVCRTVGKSALLPGDYIYNRMAIDPSSMALASQGYDAVVVPHHGDEASSAGIFKPTSARSIAFFSAGDHIYYKHPRQESLDEHAAKGYNVVEDRDTPHIKSRQVLP
jgi:beta-lactamase superfamily II metal-dependent hydrolase